MQKSSLVVPVFFNQEVLEPSCNYVSMFAHRIGSTPFPTPGEKGINYKGSFLFEISRASSKYAIEANISQKTKLFSALFNGEVRLSRVFHTKAKGGKRAGSWALGETSGCAATTPLWDQMIIGNALLADGFAMTRHRRPLRSLTSQPRGTSVAILPLRLLIASLYRTITWSIV